VRVQILLQQLPEGSLWRVCEADGVPVARWLPLEPFEGALDRGGFRTYSDALGFGLGIDLVRAEAGFLGDLTARDIERERAELDLCRAGPLPTPKGPPFFEAA
jgi:hypothetical protein